MKQQIIPGLKKKLLLVEFDYWDSVRMEDENNLLYKGEKIIKIGKLTDITESQFKQWVEDWFINESYTKYHNYLMPTRFSGFNQSFDYAEDSFFSKLEKDEIHFSNPLGEYPTKQNTGLEYGMEYISKVASWEEVQEEVWDKNRTWCFGIIS